MSVWLSTCARVVSVRFCLGIILIVFYILFSLGIAFIIYLFFYSNRLTKEAIQRPQMGAHSGNVMINWFRSSLPSVLPMRKMSWNVESVLSCL